MQITELTEGGKSERLFQDCSSLDWYLLSTQSGIILTFNTSVITKLLHVSVLAGEIEERTPSVNWALTSQ